MAGLEDALNPEVEQEGSEQPNAGEFKPKYVSNEEQKKYLGKIKKRNKYLLLSMTAEEKKRVANFIIDKYLDAKDAQDNLCDKIDTWDDVSRMIRAEVIGTDGNMPNYRTPLSFVAHEVIHANIMNTFFTPIDTMRVLPTSADDIEKTETVARFGNWSMKNELDLFNKIDQLFHASEKQGESVAMIYWKKEYGVEIKREPMVGEDGETVYDQETQEPVFQEIEEPKLVYNAPYMEIINRKDYLQPADARMGETPEWEGRIVRVSYDTYLKDELQGKYYDGSIDLIKNWDSEGVPAIEHTDYDGDAMPVGKWKKEFVEFYGRIRLTIVKENPNEIEAADMHELEDEFEALVHIQSRTLAFIKKNRRPMKERPFVNDYFVPDDTGRRAAIGVYELLDSTQKCYDALFNTYLYSTQLANQPIFFFSPTGNLRDERMRVQAGFMYPSSDPKSVQMFNFKGPDESIKFALGLAQQWAQLMFGISDYVAGQTSQIDPTAPAKKVEIIVEQGNVRLNMIIKRKNDTLKKIFKRWFLLYRDNMPPNKFMRIAGEGKDPFKFQSISYEDFALNSIPDFELVGNVLNSNKQLEMQKAVAVFQMLAPTPLFSPQTREGLQGLISLVKWLVSKIDDMSLTAFLPQLKEGNLVHTPEEENALMLQGQTIDPMEQEDHVYHLKIHMGMLQSPNTPEEVKALLGEHVKQTVMMLKQQMTQQIAMQHQAQQVPPMQGGIPTAPLAGGTPGGMNGNESGNAGAAGAISGMVPGQ